MYSNSALSACALFAAEFFSNSNPPFSQFDGGEGDVSAGDIVRDRLNTDEFLEDRWQGVGEPGDFGLRPVHDDAWLVSATDLMVEWSPDMQSSEPHFGPGMWDRYFGVPSKSASVPSADPLESDDESLWNAEAAEDAVDRLFEFLQALERRDCDAAMLCIAEKYHHIESDAEVCRTALKLKIEWWIEHWRHCDAAITLTSIPQPVFCSGMILIEAVIQIDYRERPESPPRTELLSRIVVLSESDESGWRISSLSPIDL